MRRSGHIRQRSAGSWELRYSLGTDPATGRRRVVTTTYAGDRKAAERELRRLLRELDTGEHVDPTRLTVGTWLTEWLGTVQHEVSPKSHERYSEIVAHFLIPAFGSLPLTKLGVGGIRTPDTVTRMPHFGVQVISSPHVPGSSAPSRKSRGVTFTGGLIIPASV